QSAGSGAPLRFDRPLPSWPPPAQALSAPGHTLQVPPAAVPPENQAQEPSPFRALPARLPPRYELPSALLGDLRCGRCCSPLAPATHFPAAARQAPARRLPRSPPAVLPGPGPQALGCDTAACL